MFSLIIFFVAFMLGYLYGYKIKPNKRLRHALQQVKEQCREALEEGNKGIYKTIVTEDSKLSELVVEVKELAVTEGGQVKVAYLSADYKNPAFRNKKGEALLREVRQLLGDYLPLHEIEWYETRERHQQIEAHAKYLDQNYKKQFRL